MRNIVVLGAGRVGRALLKLLENQSYKVTIVEQSKQVCEELAMQTNATVINGDMTNPSVLDELKLGSAEYVFAVTGSEETNFLSSIYAREVGAKRIIARVTEGKHALIFERLGIDALISEYTLAKEISNRVSSPTIYKLLDPKVSEIELYEKVADKKYSGKKISEIDVGPKSMVVAVFHDNVFSIAKPETVVPDGATLVIVRGS